jgi:hypothetical protein
MAVRGEIRSGPTTDPRRWWGLLAAVTSVAVVLAAVVVVPSVVPLEWAAVVSVRVAPAGGMVVLVLVTTTDRPIVAHRSALSLRRGSRPSGVGR